MDRFLKCFVNNFEIIKNICNHKMVKISWGGDHTNLQENNKEYKTSAYVNSA